jgi:hypothetical protein
MATVNKNFKVKHGLVVEGTTGTINGENILTESQDSINFIVNTIGGTATSANTANAVVKRDANGNFAAGSITADLVGNADTATSLESSRTIELTGDVTGSVSFDGTSNVQISTALNGSYATDAEVATAKSEAISTAASDATAKAGAALASANSYTDDEIGSLDLSLKAYADQAETDAASTAAAYTDARETAITSAYQSYADTAESDAKAYADQKVADLVGNAPELLNTLNELAEAIADDENFATTITTLVGTKADTSYVNSEISDLDTAAQGYATTAQTNANSYTDTEITQEVADRNSAISDAINTEVTNRNSAITAAIGQEVVDRDSAITTAVNGLTTTDIEEGDNLYFTNQRAIDAVGGTIGSQIDLLDTDDIEEGSDNLYFTNARAISATAASYDVLGAAAAAETSARGYADGLAVNYDAAGSANTAYSDAVAAAALDATTKANNAKSGAEATASADATSKANAAQAAAEATAASALSTAISTEVTDRNNAISSAIATEVTDRNTAISTAVSGLVDGAPALLDTLNELALALGDSPDTITNLTTLVGDKAPLASPALTGVPTAPTAAADTSTTQIATTAFAKAEADAAQAAAEATASSDATSKANAAQAAAEATAQAALDDVLDGTTAFTEINVNSEAKQIAATSSSLGSVIVTAYSWPKAEYRSAKLMVKIDNSTDNEVSEILLTLDSADNIAITEYAIVGTNGSRGSITARVSGANVEVRVDPVNDSTIKVTGTLLK